MTTPANPADGDIVVALDVRHGGINDVLVYTQNARIGAIGADPYSFGLREEAIAYALPLAKRRHVPAWLTDNGVDFDLLEDFRAVGSS